jgi:hypothetical protein
MTGSTKGTSGEPTQVQRRHTPMILEDEDDEQPAGTNHQGDLHVCPTPTPLTMSAGPTVLKSLAALYPSSSEGSSDHSPPAKRVRQGTIGAEGRAKILATESPTKQARSVGAEHDASSVVSEVPSSPDIMASPSPTPTAAQRRQILSRRPEPGRIISGVNPVVPGLLMAKKLKPNPLARELEISGTESGGLHSRSLIDYRLTNGL